MRNFKRLFYIAPMALASRCFAKSLYLTSPVPLPPQDDRFEAMMPYFPEVKTMITVQITKGAWNKDLPGPCEPACTTDGKPTSGRVGTPTCSPGGKPTVVDGNAFCVPSGSLVCSVSKVASAEPTCVPAGGGYRAVCTSTGTPPVPSSPTCPSGDGPTCASASAKPACISDASAVCVQKIDSFPTCQPTGGGGGYGPPALTISVKPVGVSRGFLYYTKNPFFSDTANVSISSDGLLSNSDSSSTQQITAILTELAQTAAAVAPVPAPKFAYSHHYRKAHKKGVKHEDHEKELANRRHCASVITNLPSPWIKRYFVQRSERNSYPIYRDNSTSISLRLEVPPVTSDERVTFQDGAHYGLVAFYPVPAIVTLACQVGGGEGILFTPPDTINVYTESHLLDPQRDFLSDPQDTYTFSSGIITGHKYTAQSPAKTIVDTVTAPVRALMPSVSVTTNTQVTTGGGKPDQTTTTTGSTVAPPKGP